MHFTTFNLNKTWLYLKHSFVKDNYDTLRTFMTSSFPRARLIYIFVTSFSGDICPTGSYCVSGSASPTPCAPGTFNPSTKAIDVSKCLSCTAGKYCGASGLSAVSGSCQQGKGDSSLFKSGFGLDLIASLERCEERHHAFSWRRFFKVNKCCTHFFSVKA